MQILYKKVGNRFLSIRIDEKNRKKILRLYHLFLLCPILCLVLVTHSETGAEEAYRYLEKIGSDTEIYNWRLLEEKDKVKIISIKDNETFYNVCYSSGVTLEWKVKKADMDINAWVENQILTIQGNLKGEKIDKRFNIGDTPWYQPLSYSLKNFLISDQSTVVFWTIRPDNLSLVKMKAEKENIEPIMINGEEIAAQKVRVSLNSLFSIFWHCYYWFRTTDGLFLRYEGSRGLSEKNKMTIKLINIDRKKCKIIL